MLCCIRQVKLDSGSLIYAPSDNDRFVKLLLGVPDTATDRLLARERAGWVEQEDMPADSEESSSAPTMSWDDIANWDKPPSYPPPYPPNHDDCDEDERSDWPRQDWSPGEKGSGHGLSLEIEGRPMRNAKRILCELPLMEETLVKSSFFVMVGTFLHMSTTFLCSILLFFSIINLLHRNHRWCVKYACTLELKI